MLRNRISYLLIFILLCSLLAAACASLRRRVLGEAEIARIGAVEYLPLESVKNLYGFNYEWNPEGREAVFHHKGQTLKISGFHPYINLHGKDRKLLYPPIFKNDTLYVPRALAEFSWWEETGLVSREAKVFWDSGRREISRVVIDAGHGGCDKGAVAYGVEEKEIVLDVAQRVKERLVMYGIHVIMTRDDDTYPSLPDRTWIGNVTQPDLFLSIHANAAPSSKVSGIETYHIRKGAGKGIPDPLGPDASEQDKLLMTPNDLIAGESWTQEVSDENRRKSAFLAASVHQALKQGLDPVEDRGIKEAGFYVLKWTNVPAALVEIGFMSHEGENLKLANSYYRSKIARALADGILDYLMSP